MTFKRFFWLCHGQAAWGVPRAAFFFLGGESVWEGVGLDAERSLRRERWEDMFAPVF
jgi:hypothetical protein